MGASLLLGDALDPKDLESPTETRGGDEASRFFAFNVLLSGRIQLIGHPSSRNVLHLAFDRVSAAWDNLVSGATMNFQRITLAVVLTGVAAAAAMAQSPSDQQLVDP